MSRPEHSGPPELFYNEDEAAKYASSSRMAEIQTELSERAYELLALPEDKTDCYLLDIGCGSGLSGDVLSEAGHYWVGVDISRAMLDVAVAREECDGLDVVVNDIGQGLPFRAGIFDGAISISALQWLCNADFSGADPRKRLQTFFTSLYHCLARGAKAVLQWYPENERQTEMVTHAAMKCGFTGGNLVDFPHSAKAKKHYLVLFAGYVGVPQPMPTPLGMGAGDEVAYSAERERGSKRGRDKGTHKEYVLHKKARQRAQGKEVRPDSKFSGRKRGPKF